MSENKEKTAGELLREKLVYKPKNGFKTLTDTELAVVDAYGEGYKTYLDAAKTEREAAKQAKAGSTLPCGCPGTQSRALKREPVSASSPVSSQLLQWPVQIKLVPVNAPYFDNANHLVAADCTAFAYGNFHNEFIRNHITLIGCPKLDDGDYAEKLTQIITNNNIKSVTVARMEVPCCGGIENAVKRALQASGKFIPWRVVTISTDGRIID